MKIRPPWIVVATGDDILCRWVCRIAAASGATPVAARDLPSAFEALGDDPAALVVRHRFDGVAAEQVIAFVRASGSRLPVVVLGDFLHRRLGRPPPLLAPVVLLPDPFDARALRESLRRAIAHDAADLRQGGPSRATAQQGPSPSRRCSQAGQRAGAGVAEGAEIVAHRPRDRDQ